MCDIRKLPGFADVDRLLPPGNTEIRLAMHLLFLQAYAAGQAEEIQKNAELHKSLTATLAELNGQIAQNVRRVREITRHVTQSGKAELNT